MTSSLVIAAGATVAAVLLFVIVQYNKLVARRLRIRESWANVDTELKRRHDLVPNLVRTVQGYATHERALFERVAEVRAAAVRPGDTHERRDAEAALTSALGQVLAVAEEYPELRASEHFLLLQRQLAETEDRIQAARRFYNGNVRDYNNQVLQIPSNLVAKAFGFRTHEYFEVPTVAERAAPPVRLSGPAPER